jgi:RNA-directed DNA polymerase
VKQAKPFEIPKRAVWDAYRRVKANRGAAGVDQETLEEFERKLEGNLYKLWNRLCSGSYMPPPVRVVEIPKSGGGKRKLGIPTVMDRVAQTVAKSYLEPLLEPYFHPDSYGYRPGRSALEAVGVARQRCFEQPWVLDLDIEGFFDNIDHELLLRALRRHTQERWLVLYIERWLRVPAQNPDGSLTPREQGTPQGGVISPLLANLFLHYAFDEWMRRSWPQLRFERYADDIIVHCSSEAEALAVRQSIEQRLAECRLRLHPQKTKIVYCKSSKRPGNHPNIEFDFLGYRFGPRSWRARDGRMQMVFTPAISQKAAMRIRRTIRRWSLARHTGRSLEELAKRVNPLLRGWITYYGRYRRSRLHDVFQPLDDALRRWARRKFVRLKRSFRRARGWLARVRSQQPMLFAHWQLSPAGRG